MNNFIKNLPRLFEYTNLHLINNIKSIVAAHKGIAGVYVIINNITGAAYVSSSINLDLRINHHFIYHSTNEHLQNVFSLYGLNNFTLVIVEFYEINLDLIKGTLLNYWLLNRSI